jgi:AraC-like DNA-binding protein
MTNPASVFALPVPPGCFRVGPVLPFTELLAQFGCPVESLLARLGMAANAFTRPDAVMHYRDGAALIALAVQETRCAHLGLLIGQRSGLSSLGLVGDLAATETTVRDALRTIVRHLPLFDRGCTLTLRVEPREATFACGITVADLPIVDQIYDLVLSVMCTTLRDLCGPTWAPRVVNLPHAIPPDMRPFRTHFRSDVRFDAPTASIVFDPAWLGRAPAAAKPIERAIALDQVAAGSARLDLTIGEQVRRELRAALPGRWLGESDVSARLNIDRSTLRRRLAREGSGFRAVAEALRMETARHYLATSSMDCGEIALLLGYSEPSAFARAFRRAAGTSPTAWRRLNRTRHS